MFAIIDCKAEYVSSSEEYAWSGNNFFTKTLRYPHLSMRVVGISENGTIGYFLHLEYRRPRGGVIFEDGGYDPTYSIPNATLLIRTADGNVIKKTSAYNETKDYVKTTQEKSVSEVVNGKLVTRTIPSQETHNYTAMYAFAMTPEEFKQISKGVLKIKLEANPIFEKTYKKDNIGKKIWKLFKEIVGRVPKSFDENF